MALWEELRATQQTEGAGWQPRVIPRAEQPENGALSDAEIDAAIMREAATDLTAFAPLYERYFKPIYDYCRWRTNSPAEAEDLTSLIFTRALNGVSSYRGGSVAAWLFRIARNTVINHYRRRRPHVSLDSTDLQDEAQSMSEYVIRDEQRETIRRMLQTLTPEEQELLALKIDVGLTSEEIGAILGKHPTTVRVMLHRIIKRLRALFPEGVL